MTNPYQPPTEASDAAPKVKTRPSVYLGGYSGVTSLATMAGISVGLLVTLGFGGTRSDVALVLIYGAPALGWFFTLIALMSMLKGVQISGGTMVVTAFTLSIPAYILYVPVCSFASMFTTPVLGTREYFPTTLGVLIGSAVAFLAIVSMCAAILRWSFRVPVVEDAPVEHQEAVIKRSTHDGAAESNDELPGA